MNLLFHTIIRITRIHHNACFHTLFRRAHISYAGPLIYFSADKVYHVEDHPYCGPIFVNLKGDPLENQPRESAAIWKHINAWYQQGKKVQEIDGKKWAVYATDVQLARRAGRAAAPADHQQPGEQP